MTGAREADGQYAQPEHVRRQAARQLEARYQGVLAWWGAATGSWWAYVPAPANRLLEAAEPRLLAEQITYARGGWPS